MKVEKGLLPPWPKMAVCQASVKNEGVFFGADFLNFGVSPISVP